MKSHHILVFFALLSVLWLGVNPVSGANKAKKNRQGSGGFVGICWLCFSRVQPAYRQNDLASKSR